MADEELAAFVAEAFPRPVADPGAASAAEDDLPDQTDGTTAHAGTAEARPLGRAAHDDDEQGDAAAASATSGTPSLLPVFASPPELPDAAADDEQSEGSP